MPPVKTNFRQDINGLRAWAVVVVILYHFGVSGFGGGFIGVDIFFVISGFLMTGIVIKGLEQGSFSIPGFYMARARRIIPALLGLCSVLLILGWFFLLPPDYKTLGTHVISSLGFFSNIMFWDEAGYFDVASHEKWLLHTWSLSVEWQFYLILPIVLWVVWRLKPGRSAQALTIIIGIGISLSASIWTTLVEPSTAFYWLHTRAWEMLSGGLVYLYANRLQLAQHQARWLANIGLLMILGSVLVFNSESSWPGWRAIIPVLATMLVITANSTSFWTGHKVAQWLGDRSYSLYLWHWPVYVGLVYVEHQNQPISVLAALLLTLAIGHFSYIWIENPTRRTLARKSFIAGAGIVAFGVSTAAVPALMIRATDGVSGRFSSAIELAAAESNNINPRKEACHPNKGKTSPSCVYGGKSWGVVALGDSHASVIVTSLAKANPNKQSGEGTVQWTYSGCSFVLGLNILEKNIRTMDRGWQCLEFIEWAKLQMESLPKTIPIVLVNRYVGYGQGTKPNVYFSKVYATATPEFFEEFGRHITETACQLARSRTVYVVRPIPEMGVDVPKTLSRRMALKLNTDISTSLVNYHKRNAWVWAAQDLAQKQCGVIVLDPTAYLCDKDQCYGSKNGRPLYSDDDHLSEFGNTLLIPMFAQIYRKK